MCFRKQDSLLDTGHLEPYDGIATQIARRGGPTFDIDLEHFKVPTIKKMTLAKSFKGFFPVDKGNNIRGKEKWSLKDILASNPTFRVVSMCQVSFVRYLHRTPSWYH